MTDDVTTTFLVQLGVGRLLDEDGRFEVGGQVLAAGSDVAGLISVNPYVRNNVRITDRAWLYCGVQVGVLTTIQASGSSSALGYGVHGGLKYWLTPTASLYIEPRVNRTSMESELVETELIDFTTILGLSLTF